MDTIFDKPLNKELNDKPDYATEMPMSDSDSTTVSQAIAKKQPYYDAGIMNTADVSTGIASAVKAARNAGYLVESRETAIVAFSLNNNVPYTVNVIGYNGGTFYFTAHTYNNAWRGYVGITDTTCASLNQLVTTERIKYINGSAGQTVDTGISVNGGFGGRTLFVIISSHTSSGDATSSGLYLVRCGYSGDYFSSYEISKQGSGGVFTISKSSNNTVQIHGTGAWTATIIGSTTL